MIVFTPIHISLLIQAGVIWSEANTDVVQVEEITAEEAGVTWSEANADAPFWRTLWTGS